jgi:alpha-amylase
VVFNHMTSEASFGGLDKFPGSGRGNFHDRCPINFHDGNTSSEITCWLNGDLPDLKQEDQVVLDVEKEHLKRLLDLGIDGFRFDGAKYMEPQFVKEYIDYADRESHGATWNYLEVIEDGDTSLERYNWIAAVTDFRLYGTLTTAFGFDGDLRALRVPSALDARSVTFGGNHDTRRKIGNQPLNTWDAMPCTSSATRSPLARNDRRLGAERSRISEAVAMAVTRVSSCRVHGKGLASWRCVLPCRRSSKRSWLPTRMA